MAHGAPPQDRDADLRRVEFAPEVGDLVRQFVRTLDRGRIDAVLHHRLEGRSLEDRLADARARPGHDLSIPHAAAHPVHDQRAVIAAADIVLPCPHELHRPPRADRLGNLGKLG